MKWAWVRVLLASINFSTCRVCKSSIQPSKKASLRPHPISSSQHDWPSITVRSQRKAQVTPPHFSLTVGSPILERLIGSIVFLFSPPLLFLSFCPLLSLFIWFDFISSQCVVFLSKKKGKRKKEEKKEKKGKKKKESPANSPSRRSFPCVSRRSERSTDGTWPTTYLK